MQLLIRDLVIHLHHDEPDPDAVILVFLPTYKALELQHKLLSEADGWLEEPGSSVAEGSCRNLVLLPLHSSVDIDDAMKTMQVGMNALK